MGAPSWAYLTVLRCEDRTTHFFVHTLCTCVHAHTTRLSYGRLHVPGSGGGEGTVLHTLFGTHRKSHPVPITHPPCGHETTTLFAPDNFFVSIVHLSLL